jgi:hypothetical protein
VSTPVPGYAHLLTARTTNVNLEFWSTRDRRYRFYGYGTFAGASLSVQVTTDGTTWITLGDTLTSAGIFEVFCAKDESYRVVLSGATGSTSISLIAVELYHYTGTGRGEGGNLRWTVVDFDGTEYKLPFTIEDFDGSQVQVSQTFEDFDGTPYRMR